MFSFAYPKVLYLLILVPLYVALYILARYSRRKNLKRFGKIAYLLPMMPEVSDYKAPLKICVQMLALSMLIVACARPWGGVRNQKTTKEGIGLIVYANSAYTLIPVTNDYVSAKMFLNSIDPTQIKDQGTNISAAIDMAVNSFSDNKNVGKALILITDAEELDDKETVMATAANAGKKGIQVDVVGIGSTTPVTVPENGALMLDPETGQPVRTALNEDLAAEIAKSAKGIYVNASNRDALSELERQLDTLKKSTLESSVYAQHDELFYIFAVIALVLMCIDIFLLERKIAWLDKITFFTNRKPKAKAEQK